MNAEKKAGKPVGKIIFFIVLFFHPLFFINLYFAGNWYSLLHDYSLGMLFGIIGYCYLSTALLLSARIRIFDRLIGQDRVIRFHGYLAFTGIISGIIHLLFKLAYISFPSFQTVSGVFALAIFIILMIMTFIYMIEKFYIPFPGLKSLKSFIIKNLNLDYSVMKNLHNGFSLALAFLIVHVLLSYSTSENIIRFSLMSLPGGISLIRYIYFKYIRVHYIKKNYFNIEGVEENAPAVVTVKINPRGKKFPFSAGQYVYMKIISSEINREEHPFTISSPPSADTLSLTVRETGDYTDKLSSVRKGDKALIDGPYGLFTPSPGRRKKLFIAGGIGITPFLSVLKEWEKVENMPDVNLLWSLSYKADIIERDFLQGLSEKREWFTFSLFISREIVPGCKHGRISLEDFRNIITPENSASFDVYICGPADFRKSAGKMLSSLGIPSRDIHFESFSS